MEFNFIYNFKYFVQYSPPFLPSMKKKRESYTFSSQNHPKKGGGEMANQLEIPPSLNLWKIISLQKVVLILKLYRFSEIFYMNA